LENIKEKHHMEDLGIDGWKNNINTDLKREWEGVDWINVTQDKDKWWAFVKTEVKIWVS
jgi:hypothetical protein